MQQRGGAVDSLSNSGVPKLFKRTGDRKHCLEARREKHELPLRLQPASFSFTVAVLHDRQHGFMFPDGRKGSYAATCYSATTSVEFRVAL